MFRNFTLTRVGRVLFISLVLAAAGLVGMQSASAGCGQFAATAKKMADLRESGTFGAPRFIHADLESDAENLLWDYRFDRAIVGLWHFRYISEGNSAAGIPDGTQVDGGNTTWYADGNEMTSSEMRAPDTGSICLGVWKQTGKLTYELNHIGLSWDPVNNVFVGPAFIKQYVKLQPDGNAYSGTFTVTQMKADGQTVAMVIKGTIAATRVDLNTTTQPQ